MFIYALILCGFIHSNDDKSANFINISENVQKKPEVRRSFSDILKKEIATTVAVLVVLISIVVISNFFELKWPVKALNLIFGS